MSYTPLRINTIKPEIQIPFDLYIHFKDQYLCYQTQGLAIDNDKFKKLKKQKIAKFYIKSEDEKNYQQFLDKLIEDTLNSPNASVEDKVVLVEEASSTAIEQIQKDPGSESSYKMTQTATGGLRKLITDNPTALKTMFEKKALPHEVLVKHSLNVCLLATKLAEKLKLSDEEIQAVMIAALMHDIGVTNSTEPAQKIFEKNKKDFTPEDRRHQKEHIESTLKAIKEKPYIKTLVIQLIQHHEEVLSGTGPYKLTKLSPAEECLSLVNSYDKKILIGEISPKEALKELMVDELGNYELKTLNKFKEVLQKEGLIP